MMENHLVDIWREKYPNKKSYTWSQKTPKIECRLDYFFIPSKGIKHVQNTYIDTNKTDSDHRPIFLNIEMEQTLRGPGYWKLNNSLLNDADSCTNIEKISFKELGMKTTIMTTYT